MPYTKKASTQPTKPQSSERRLTRSSGPVSPVELSVDSASKSDDETAAAPPAGLPDTDDPNNEANGNDVTPTPARIGTRVTNATQHPGEAANKYKQKRRTASEMEAARILEAEAQEKREREREAVLNKIAELEQSLLDNQNFGSTPRAVIPARRKLQRQGAFLEIPGPATDGELMQVDNDGDSDARMDVDEGEDGEYRQDEESATEPEHERPTKKVKTATDIVAKGVAKGGAEGEKPVGNGKGKGKSKKITRSAIDNAREQIAKKRMELEAEEVVAGTDSDLTDRDGSDVDVDQQKPGIVPKSGAGNKLRHVFPPASLSYHAHLLCSQSHVRVHWGQAIWFKQGMVLDYQC